MTKNEIVEEESSKMAELLEGSVITKLIKEGDKLTGKIVDITSHAAYVDLGLTGAGIIYGKEVKDGFGLQQKKLGVGDEISAAVILIENEDGYVELSITEAVREEAWRDLLDKQDDKKPVSVKILDVNKGGLMIELNGIRGFMPVSQLTAEHYPRVEDGDKNKILEILKGFIDTEMTVCVIAVDESEEKLIVSEKEAHKDKERELIAEFKVGDIVEGEVSGVVDFGAFVKFLPPSKAGSNAEEDELEGLVHISQLDWQLISNPREVVKVGDKVKAKVISIDGTRISLSIRDLKNDPWMSVEEKYKVGSEYKGKINKINHFGAFVYLDKDIHGLAHVSGFPGYPKSSIDEVVEMEKEYMWKIMSVEANSHRMGLKFVGEVGKTTVKDDETKTNDKKSDKKEPKKVVSPSKTDQSKAEETAEKVEKKADKKDSKKNDDLTKIEGIGPKIAEVLAENGVDTFAKLADAKDKDTQEMIKDVRGNHDSGTWNEQAALARDEKWDELEKMQDELDGGKKK
jgi:small subunit ribosomal protein S1